MEEGEVGILPMRNLRLMEGERECILDCVECLTLPYLILAVIGLLDFTVNKSLSLFHVH